MKYVRKVLFILHLVVGIGACAGGYACIVDPLAPLGAPLALLEGSPFDSFLIPGMVLFGLFGIGNLFGAVQLHRRFRWQGYIAGILGVGMVVWIIVQVLVIGSIVFLHVLFLIIGIVQAVIGYLLLAEEDQFPVSLIRKFKSKIATGSRHKQ